MKKSLVFLLLTFPIYSFAQNESYKDYYLKNIRAEQSKYGTTAYLNISFVQNEPMKSMLDNDKFSNYYLINFTDKDIQKGLLDFDNQTQLQKEYLTRLEKDTLFNQAIKDLYEKAVINTVSKDTFSLNQLLNTAVKFFAITGISEDGRYSTHVCVGVNDVSKTEITRKPALEAFAFSTIIDNLSNPRYKVMDDFVESLTKLADVGLGIVLEEKLLRSQGALFLLMKESKGLKGVLMDQYTLLKDYLPFVIVEKDDKE